MLAKGTWRHAAFGVWMLLWSWAPAIGAIAVCARWPSVWTFCAALVIVSARQHALFVVAHESWHKTMFRSSRWNTFAGSWLAAYPVVIPWGSARHAHLQHHRTVGTADDPDRYSWFWHKNERAAFVRYLLAMATGIPFAVRTTRHVLGLPVTPREGFPTIVTQGGGGGDQIRIVVTHALLLGAFTATVGWVWYLTLWLWPAISMRLVLEALRLFLEHRGGRFHVYRAGPIERFVLGPFNFHLHAYHHAYASEPWFGLARVGARAKRKYTIYEHPSYRAELLAFFRGKSQVPEPEEPPASGETSGETSGEGSGETITRADEAESAFASTAQSPQ